MGPNLAILACQPKNSHWRWDPTLQYLHVNLKFTLEMGPNLTILACQPKIHIGDGTHACNIYMKP